MAKNNKAKKGLFESEVIIGGVNLTQKALFIKHLSVMLRSGLTINEALYIAYDSASGRLKKVLGGVIKSVEAGHSLSSSFAIYPKIFSGLITTATYAGEESGTLDDSLESIAEQLKKDKELTAKIKGAMMYPLVVLGAAFILGMGMAFFVLPKITPLFEGLKMDLPITTRGLIIFSDFIQNHGIGFFVGVVGFITLFIWLIKQKFSKPFTHIFILKVPIVKKISRNANLSRFCRSLSTLLKSGLNIDEAFNITKDTLSNYYYKRAVGKISNRIKKGTKISDNLSSYSNLFPVMVTRMVKVGEESGKLEETLLYLADFYDTEVENATKNLSSAIEPLLLVFIGLTVGFLALSIITPIYSITGGVQR